MSEIKNIVPLNRIMRFIYLSTYVNIFSECTYMLKPVWKTNLLGSNLAVK